MQESFEMLPYGGAMVQSEVERQLSPMRGGGRARGAAMQQRHRVLSRRAPMLRTAGRPHMPYAPRGRWYPRPLYGPWAYPWTYPWGATVNVFDDGSAAGANMPRPDAAAPDDGLPDEGSPQEELHPMACRCGACRGVAQTFDILPFTLNQHAALAGRANWRARRG